MIVPFTLVGAFVPRSFVFDWGWQCAFGIHRYIGAKDGYHVAAILIGVFLGPLVEQSYIRALRISWGDPLVCSPELGNVLWVMLILRSHALILQW